MRTKKLLRMQMFHQCIFPSLLQSYCDARCAMRCDAFPITLYFKTIFKRRQKRPDRICNDGIQQTRKKNKIQQKMRNFGREKMVEKNSAANIVCCIHAKCPFLMICSTVHTFYTRFVAALFHFTSCTWCVQFGSLRCTLKPS